MMKNNLIGSFRCEGDISRSDSDCSQTRNQSGHPILCDELTAQLVQRWEIVLPLKTKSAVTSSPFLSSYSFLGSINLFDFLLVPSFLSCFLRDIRFRPLRWWPQTRNASNCHSDVWSDRRRCQCFWKHTFGCGENQDAGTKHIIWLWLLLSPRSACWHLLFFCRVWKPTATKTQWTVPSRS